MRVGRFRFSLVTAVPVAPRWRPSSPSPLVGVVPDPGRGAHHPGNQWQNLIIAGIALGSVYALIALGYTLVYGILFMINFAHGEVFMWGAFTAFFAATGAQRRRHDGGEPDPRLLPRAGHRDARQHDRGDHARAHRLPAAPRRAAARAADHRHRRIAVPAVHGARLLRLRRARLPRLQPVRRLARPSARSRSASKQVVVILAAVGADDRRSTSSSTAPAPAARCAP